MGLRGSLFLLFCCLVSPAYALLSPLNQSIVEINALLSSNEIRQAFSQGAAVKKIERVEYGYLISTPRVQMLAEIRYVPNKVPGRQQFEFVFHPPTPLAEWSNP